MRKLQADVRQGYRWVVDLDLQAFFDRVNHDRLMTKLKSQINDPALLRLINSYLKTGIQIGDTLQPSRMGVPQGGPLSPLLANIVLNELVWEGSATVSPATLMTATSSSKVNARESESWQA